MWRNLLLIEGKPRQCRQFVNEQINTLINISFIAIRTSATTCQQTTFVLPSSLLFSPSYPLPKDMTTDKKSFHTTQPKVQNMVKRKKNYEMRGSQKQCLAIKIYKYRQNTTKFIIL